MKLTYRQFLKTPVDLSPLGILPVENFQPYFCTPKGARVFGRSGVDGIHFCFVRGFGETVFAVSPMNGREGCVHPAAKTFQDFLRLLLALHDAAAIEQAWQWNAAQLEDFEQKHPSSDAQRAVLEKIAGTFGLRPMAEPWKYIHTVQSGFDYGKLRFSEEFYDDDRSLSAPDAAWKVTFEGGFRSAKGKGGRAVSLGKAFSWAGEEWLVPAAYLCREGIVLDIFKRVSAERLFAFRETWELSAENDGSDWNQARRMRAMAENPFEEQFGAELTVNGQALRQNHGCALCWDPLYPDGNDKAAKLVREHYRLDELDGWVLWRLYFPWKSKKETKLQTVSLRLWADRTELLGPEFSPEKVGDTLRFQLPEKEESYTIMARELQVEKLSYHGQTLYTTELAYEFTPELSTEKVVLRDVSEQIALPLEGGRSCAAGVIGGADGLVVLCRSEKNVCSNVRREEKQKVSWHLVFREKRKEDLRITLLGEEGNA